MKKRNLILSSASILGTAGFLGIAASCGSRENESWVATSKDIYIAKDGVQKDFYNKVEELFKQTDSYKKGYRLNFIDKGVFDALDSGTTGATAREFSDILYAPQDRLADLAQGGVITFLDSDKFNGIFDHITQKLNISEEDKQEMKEFGSIRGVSNDGQNRPVSRLAAIRHNKEGMILVSNQDEATTRAELLNESTDTLKELVMQGKALFRFQDFWFGNGLLAGALKGLGEEELIKNILYSKNGEVSSIFVKSDENHDKFKQALKIYSQIFYPVYEAAYVKNAAEYNETVWAKKGISQSDLRETMKNNVGDAQAKIFELMKSGKLNYTVIGSWDAQNSEKFANVKSFFTVPYSYEEGNKKYQFIQGPGSWSYAINARNNAASEERVQAIKDILDQIFTVDSYYAYFSQDSKIPFAKTLQDSINNKFTEEKNAKNSQYDSLAKSLGYQNFAEMQSTLAAELQTYNTLSSRQYEGWSKDTSKDPLNDANITKVAALELFDAESLKKPAIKAKNDELKTKLKDSVDLRNALAAILGITNIDDLAGRIEASGKLEQWLVGQDKLKDGVVAANPDLQQSPLSFHLRKLEKAIFGVNGDEGSQRDAVYNRIMQAIKSPNSEAEIKKLYDAVKENAKKLSKDLAKTTVDVAQVERAAELYFNGYFNTAYTKQFVENILQNQNATKKDGTIAENVTNKKIAEIFAESDSFGTSTRLLNVITSTKGLKDNGVGRFITQDSRLDNSNPQFKVVWEVMNDLSFGKISEFPVLAQKGVNTFEKYVAAMEEIINDAMVQKINTIKSGNSSVNVSLPPLTK
ncbi:hypothetical protein [Mycoplasma leonicaptivi]|uniref:hypothetical protein n=1 Tax=Mycoplasma leonicaptivi TaxID=36742 RepID=UPI00055DF863|nr:hypothetical protein [Mycoplasma leonicaptivi]